ncbi:hypothetical protein EDD16DRAFT_976980 [Pisolithus croceorrhizus]|nr:hypothetical protein EDD16DRAFT_976980 [Pisolithus croceorrhizus]KAI6167187.1 hypothetical protein EDD17DRAFT_1870639 [Pisolithus thermaeus]
MVTVMKRTYSTRPKPAPTLSPPSTNKRKADDDESDVENLARLLTQKKKPRFTLIASKAKAPAASRPLKPSQQKSLTQLHFVLDSSVLRACTLCGLSYTRGAPDDEALHRSHCGRVQRGMEWGREEERESLKAGVTEISANVRIKNGTCGRIICFPANVGGRIGSKLANLLETINLALTSPPLTKVALDNSKAYLFLIPSQTNSYREKIVGCVIAQRISTAMAIASSEETAIACTHHGNDPPPDVSPKSLVAKPMTSLVAVDVASGLFCHPAALPTPLGIPRLFVSSSHRRQGIATRLLTAAAQTFIHGCPLDPLKGEVAFTQPTEGGNAVMKSWGKGFVRIYEE